MKLIRQHDKTDCGIACLAMIASHYKCTLPLSNLRKMAGTNTRGTSLLGLSTAAAQLGFKAVAVEGKTEDIKPSLQTPFIAHLNRGISQSHFTVVASIRKKSIVLYDPAKGRITCSYAEFLKEWTGYAMLLHPDEGFKPIIKEGVTLLSFLPILKPHLKEMMLVALASFLLASLGVLSSFYFRYIVDEVLFSKEASTLHVLSVGVIFLTFFKGILDYVRSQILLGLSLRIDCSLIFAYFKHILNLPIDFFETRKTGEILSRMEDARNIRTVLSENSVSILMDSIMVILIGIVLFVQASSLLWIAAATVPLSGILIIIFSRMFRKAYKQLMEETSEVQSCLVEAVAGIATVKALNAAGTVYENYERRQSTQVETSYQVRTKRAILRLLNGLIDGWGSNIIYWVGCYFILKDHMSLGQLLSFNALLASFLGPLQRLLQQQPAIQEASVAAMRLGEIMEMEAEIQKKEHSLKPEKLNGKIDIRDIQFRYGNKRLILDIHEMHIEKGQWIALVGSSGCGKSTLVKLLLKFYEVQRGEISIDDYNILDIDALTLRSHIGYVPQDIFLFSGTIAQNISLQYPESSLDEIILAAKRAQAHDFICELPDRYNTVIAERGVSLSGGERQRLALARALLGNPDILFFDEATSNLDSIAEKELQHTLASLRDSRTTTIMIAHRLSTITQCDQIFVMDKGRIVEHGNHKQLLSSQGLYRKLWEGAAL